MHFNTWTHQCGPISKALYTLALYEHGMQFSEPARSYEW